MLDPYKRTLLLEHLQSPDGYDLDYAIGTTFSLDLVALMLVPTAFATVDVDTSDLEKTDLVWLLAALKNYGDRFSIFCQGGGIHLPPSDNVLITYLENNVFEVFPPHQNGVFHPKVWVLRFVAEDLSVVYRLLCLSRNLTFDRSWDVALALDGGFDPKAKTVPDNRPLCDFVRTLPDLIRDRDDGTRSEQTSRMRTMIALFADELRRVNFILPRDFSEYKFHPLGLNRKTAFPFTGTRVDRMLIISPFLTAQALHQLPGTDNILVSRPDSLAQLSVKDFEQFSKTYFLNPAACPEEDEALRGSLSGLHAKLYIADAGWDANIWLGSANATSAAFNANVEFVVQLKGKKGTCGVEVMLRNDDLISFATLLQEYQPGEDFVPVPPPEDDSFRFAFAKIQFVATVVSSDTSHELHLQYSVIQLNQWREGRNVHSVFCWPLTAPSLQIAVNDSGELSFSPLSAHELTGLFAFRLKVYDGDDLITSEFVLKCPVSGIPLNRNTAIVEQVLNSPEKVLQYLLFLLKDSNARVSASAWASDEGKVLLGLEADRPIRPTIENIPMLELLLRTLVSDRQKFDTVQRFLSEFEKSNLLPAGLLQIQGALMEAYAELYNDAN